MQKVDGKRGQTSHGLRQALLLERYEHATGIAVIRPVEASVLGGRPIL